MKQQEQQQQTAQAINTQQESRAPQHPLQQRPNNTGIPDALKTSIEALSGLSLDQVKVHYNSDKPELMNAHAYTEGFNIYIAPGQEKHLAHELWHVVQQMRKEVSKEIPLQQNKNANESKNLESSAEKEGQKALKLAKVPDLLPQKTVEKRDISKEIVQRVKKEATSHYGTFSIDDHDYNFEKDEGSKVLNLDLDFLPNENAKATKVGLVQVVKARDDNQPAALEPNQKKKMTKNGSHVDQLSENRNPLYATSAEPQENQDKLDAYETDNGRHAIKNGEEWTSAHMQDTPSVDGLVSCVRRFETAALALEGEEEGTYYGSVEWGFTKIMGRASKIDFKLLSKGVPTKNFMEAATLWNDSKTRGTGIIKKNNTPVMHCITTGGEGGFFEKSGYTLKKGDEVQLHEGNVHNAGFLGAQYVKVNIIKSDLHESECKNVYIHTKNIEDGDNGSPVVPLPLVETFINKKKTTLKEEKNGSDNGLELDKQTRMKLLEDPNNSETLAAPEQEEKWVQVEIVDGPHTQQKGWVEKAALKQE